MGDDFMAKMSTVYRCQQCGAMSPKWTGQCVVCKAWNSMVEEIEQNSKLKGQNLKRGLRGGESRVVRLSEVREDKQVKKRVHTGSVELDRVLGGGMVPGSVVLLAGEPGIGKSTLLTQLALAVAHEPQTDKVLYVCGEESVEQIRLRVDRLSQNSKLKTQNLYFLPEMDVDQIILEAETLDPRLLLVDSIQTLTTGDLAGMAGSVGQVRECALRLIELAKRKGITTFIVGHVTREGTIAGPKVLEHMVDVVINVVGDEDRLWRFAKTQKNRFGSTDEVGVFEMSEKGMVDVINPSGVFLEEIQSGVPGSATTALMEGTRPILVEIQALVVESQLAMPRRVVNGISLNKVQVLAAVLQKRCGLALGTRDIFVNVAGGYRVDEPAADLAIALAMASSYANTALPEKTVMVGEVGLLGEVRRVPLLTKRKAEAKRMGFSKTVSWEEATSLIEAVRATGVDRKRK